MAHPGGLQGLDAKTDTVATCGYAMRQGQVITDTFVKVGRTSSPTHLSMWPQQPPRLTLDMRPPLTVVTLDAARSHVARSHAIGRRCLTSALRSARSPRCPSPPAPPAWPSTPPTPTPSPSSPCPGSSLSPTSEPEPSFKPIRSEGHRARRPLTQSPSHPLCRVPVTILLSLIHI